MKPTDHITTTVKQMENLKTLTLAMKEIEKLSRYDTNHDNILYNYQDINKLAKKTLAKLKDKTPKKL